MLGIRGALVLLLLVSAIHCDDGAVVEDDDDEQTHQNTAAGDEKEEFVPIQFVTPKLSAKAHLFETFPSQSAIGKTWIKSTAKKDVDDQEIAKYNGEWSIDVPSEVSIEGDFGLIVKTKARHHAIAAKLDKPFTFDETKPLVVQYEVQFEEGQECGGGYLKLLSEGAEKDLASVQDKTPYTIMFGPDKCGTTGKVHLIFRYRNPKNGSIDEYHAKQPSNVGSTYWDDHKTHLYTLVVKPDGAFAVSVDQKSLFYGNMLSDLVPSLVPPKDIADPDDVKPSDWDDRAEIEDESAVKPEDWDESQPKEVVDEAAVKPSDWNEDEPELIPDPEATKPADWDADMDGDWEPASIDNPACKGLSGCGPWKRPSIVNPLYKGIWVRPKIANPDFKGVWAPRQIENPHYFEPTAFAGLAPISAVGIELWTMSQNIIFDNILIAESEELASEAAQQTFAVRVAEAARLAASQGNGGGVLQAVVDAANERPWLWAVYVLCVLIPVILMGVCCFGRKSKPDPLAYRKKYDSFRDDDKIPNLVGDEDEEVEEIQGDAPPAARKHSAQKEEEPTVVPTAAKASPKKSASAASKKASPSPQKKTVSKAMQDIEDDSGASDSSDDVEADVEEKVEEVKAPTPKQSPAVTKRKVRRQD